MHLLVSLQIFVIEVQARVDEGDHNLPGFQVLRNSTGLSIGFLAVLFFPIRRSRLVSAHPSKYEWPNAS